MIDELIQYGLSDREAKVYLVCLRVGQATANQIAVESELARSTTYDVLYRLKTLGLVTTYIIENRNYFIANDPEILLTSVNEKAHSIKSILPQLNSIYGKVQDKPEAVVLQGKIAVLKLIEEVFTVAKDVKLLGSYRNAAEALTYHPKKMRMKRTERSVHIRQIIEPTKQGRTVSDDEFTQTRFLRGIGRSEEATLIFDDTVLHILILRKEISAIKINSKDHAHAMTIMFEELWKKAGPRSD